MLSKTQAKYIQSLDQKKFRSQYGVFIAESPKLVRELLEMQSFHFSMICAVPEWLEENDSLIQNANIEQLVSVEVSELAKVSNLKNAHSVLAVVYTNEPEQPVLQNKLTLALDDIQDPGNMGTIIRLADWFGIQNILCSPNCVDIYNPKVVQSTMASIARVNIIYQDLAEVFSMNKDVPVYAAMLEGTPISNIESCTNGILLIGNEGHGISDLLLPLISEKITIPRFGKAESLNAAIATGIILSHLVR